MSSSVGEALPHWLREQGVTHVFGLPGVHTLELYRTLTEAGLRHIGVRHEQGAGFMADGYARASGRPGVCLVISGPGVTNITTPLGQAYSDSIPLLALSSANATANLGMGRGRLHDVTDQRLASAAVTALSATALTAEQVPMLLARAQAIFSAARPRPVHLSIPLDVLEQPAPPSMALPRPPLRAAARPELLQAAAERIAKARRSVLIAGGGAIGGAAAVAALAEKAGLPVATTVAGKGILPDGHPLALGSTLQRPEIRALIAGADLVLVAGSELDEAELYVTADTERMGSADQEIMVPGELVARGEIIRIDIDPHVLTLKPHAALPILGDAALALSMIADALPRGEHGALGPSDIAILRRRMREEVTPLEAKHIRVLDAIRMALPDDGFVAADMTQIAYTGCVHFPCRRPRSWFFPMGYGTMGYALPAGIGAKVAAPERPGVVLAGDGGLLFTVQELATAVELELPLAVVLWNNDGLAEIRDFMTARNIPQVSVSPRNPDFRALARAFGCEAVQPRSLDEITATIEQAFRHKGPTLIEIREDAPFLAAAA